MPIDRDRFTDECPLCHWGILVDPKVKEVEDRVKLVCVKCGSVWFSKKQ